MALCKALADAAAGTGGPTTLPKGTGVALGWALRSVVADAKVRSQRKATAVATVGLVAPSPTFRRGSDLPAGPCMTI